MGNVMELLLLSSVCSLLFTVFVAVYTVSGVTAYLSSCLNPNFSRGLKLHFSGTLIFWISGRFCLRILVHIRVNDWRMSPQRRGVTLKMAYCTISMKYDEQWPYAIMEMGEPVCVQGQILGKSLKMVAIFSRWKIASKDIKWKCGKVKRNRLG